MGMPHHRFAFLKKNLITWWRKSKCSLRIIFVHWLFRLVQPYIARHCTTHEFIAQGQVCLCSSMTDIPQKIISFSPDVGTVLLALIKPIWAITAVMMARSIFHGIPTWSSYSKATVGLQSQLRVMVCGHALFGAVQAAIWRPEEQNCDRKKWGTCHLWMRLYSSNSH